MRLCVEPKLTYLQAISAWAKLAFARLTIKNQERQLLELQVSNTTFKSKYEDLKNLYTELNNDRDVLQGIGVERREDGAWVFDFKVLLSRMTKEDRSDLMEFLLPGDLRRFYTPEDGRKKQNLEGFDIAYVEEAQTLTDRSLEMLRPTIRKPGVE